VVPINTARMPSPNNIKKNFFMRPHLFALNT
jgi:hypothetical protein